MKNKILVVTIILVLTLILGSSITAFAEEVVTEDGKGNTIDRSIFEPFKDKLEALKIKRVEARENRNLIVSMRDEWRAEVEELKTNRDALKENPELLTESQKTELRTILETLNAEDGPRKTLIATIGIQTPRVDAIRENRESFKENPNDEDLDEIDVLFDEIMDTQGLRISLLPEALDLIKAANAIFDPSL